MRVTVGVDVGGTKIAAAVIDEDGKIVESSRAVTPAQDHASIVEIASGLIGEFLPRFDVVGVGVAAAGFVDRDRSRVRFAPNINWRDAPLKHDIETVVGVPVVIENDANAAAWGEFLYGPAREVDHMVLLTIGTGLGGGIVLDGQLMRGAFGVAGELGHLRVVPQGLLCGCGNRGCWEQYASGNALVREARELLRTGPAVAESLYTRAGGVPEQLSGPDITEAALDGDRIAIDLLSDLGRWIGEGAASIAAVLDPHMFVLGGGVAAAGPLLLDPAVAAYRKNLTARGHRPEADWALAGLGNDAGVIGAGALARDVTR